MAESPLFRRMILGLHPGAIDREAVEFVARMADLLGVSLKGVFIEDEAVSQAGGFVHAREFQLVSHEWRPVEGERLAEDLRLAAQCAKRLLDEVARGLGMESFFEILRGDPGGVTNLADPGDILVVAMPRSPHERLAPFPWLAASLSPAVTAMLLPRRIKRRKGTVVALVETPQDRALIVAATIARAANERLVVVAPHDGELHDATLEAARAAGAPGASFAALPRFDTPTFLTAVERSGERLIVLTRSNEKAEGDIDPFMIAAARSTPVIMVGGPSAPTARDSETDEAQDTMAR